MLSAREENVIDCAVVPVLDVFRVNEPPPAGVCIVGAAQAPLLVNTCPEVQVATAAGLPLAS